MTDLEIPGEFFAPVRTDAIRADVPAVRAAEIASAAAARAEASILESYGVRILAAQDRDDADPVLEPRF